MAPTHDYDPLFSLCSCDPGYLLEKISLITISDYPQSTKDKAIARIQSILDRVNF